MPRFFVKYILALYFQIFRMNHSYSCILLLLFSFGSYAQTFSFIPETNADHQINSAINFNDNKNFGFDFRTEDNIVFSENGVTTTAPTYFSANVPEDNYQISITFYAPKEDAYVTVKAESRRLMVDQLLIPKETAKTVSFNVHLHYPAIANTEEQVSLKSRELTTLNWDEKLTLEFAENTTIQSITITPTSQITTIYLAGDSTVTDQDLEPWASWGQFFTNYINTKAVVANYAASGASLQSFYGRKRLKKILSKIKKGDYLLIEFGHNDEKIKGKTNGAYGLYTEMLATYITEARKKGAIPVLLTPTQRRFFKGESLQPTHGNFSDAMRRVARQMQVPLIDLTQITTAMYKSWGNETSRKAFVQYPANTFPGQDKKLEDNTHFNSFGANEIALAVVQEIKNQNLPLVLFLKENISDYNPNKPHHIENWTLPMSPRFESEKPYGN